jgi:hypothetical protein
MARVCPVIGTPKGNGIDICARILIIAANNAVTIIIRNFILESVIICRPPVLLSTII